MDSFYSEIPAFPFSSYFHYHLLLIVPLFISLYQGIYLPLFCFSVILSSPCIMLFPLPHCFSCLHSSIPLSLLTLVTYPVSNRLYPFCRTLINSTAWEEDIWSPGHIRILIHCCFTDHRWAYYEILITVNVRFKDTML